MEKRMTNLVQLLPGGQQDRVPQLSPSGDGRAAGENKDDRYLRDEVQDGTIEHSVSRYLFPLVVPD